MFLVLAQFGDALAQKVYERLLQRHGSDSTRLLTSDDLAVNTCWTLDQEGSAVHSEMKWPDGQRLSSDSVTAVFNRLRYATAPQFLDASLSDREYALMEMHALLLTWLSALNCVVINQPNPRSLGGELRGSAEWLLLAGRAGIPSRAMRFATSARRFPLTKYETLIPIEGSGLVGDTTLRSTNRSILGNTPVHFMQPVDSERRVVVIGERVHGDDIEPSIQSRCLQLAQNCNLALVEFTFAMDANKNTWLFCGANPFPSVLRENEIQELIRLLESRASRVGQS